ncbi:MAG: nuclear transport factor 2 family protein [Marinoscillum sp.]
MRILTLLKSGCKIVQLKFSNPIDHAEINNRNNHFDSVRAAVLAQSPQEEQKVIDLSQQKWEWMADKNVEELAPLFHDESKFVHMSGAWKKERELEIIESGSIWYKNTTVHDTDAEVIGNAAVVWSRITLEAHVRGTDVSNEFTTTETFIKEGNDWKLLALTFSSVRDTHEIEH